MNPSAPWPKRAAKAVWWLATSVAQHDIASLAAVIAFYAFFSLFPLVLLLIYTLSAALPHQSTAQLIVNLLNPFFPAVSDARAFISSNIGQLASAGNVGLLSLVTLVWSATNGFIALQQALDTIITTGQPRSVVARRVLGFLMLVALVCVALASVLAMALYSMVRSLPPFQSRAFAWVGAIQGVSHFAFPISLALGLLTCFRYLPARRMDWQYLLPGALVATVALDVGREVFVWYVGHLSHYHMIYGGLTAVMLLILWFYIGGILVLFGAEVAVLLERLDHRTPERPLDV
ncbi:MAG: YihY/virulence factor BrkB family protein [Alicyclobacillus sp.]|nr:YihY/virulence factor BrkB family protein [Alicyclobacillus sp.]